MAAIRLLFYSHDTFGLGHFRRSLTIASHLRRHLPDASALIMTGLESAYAFETPSGIDFVKLPAVKKVGPDAYRSRHLRISFNRVRRLRETLIKAVAKSYDPHMLIVDNVPRGVDGELVPTIEFLRAYRPRTKVVLTLRDILDEPARIVPLWREWGVYDLLARCYDQIWVVGWKPLFDPTAQYEFPPAVAGKTKFCGYVVQHASPDAAAAVRRELGLGDQPLTLVSAGGGGDGSPLREQWLRARALERRGLLRSIELEGLTRAGLLEAIRAGLDRAPPSRLPLDFGGLRRITQRAARLLGLAPQAASG